MSHTLTLNPDSNGPNEISWRHKLPIWAIPQLSYLRKRLGIIVTNITFDYPDSSAVIRAYLPTDKAYYLFRIYKSDMPYPNNTRIPAMYEVL